MADFTTANVYMMQLMFLLMAVFFTTSFAIIISAAKTTEKTYDNTFTTLAADNDSITQTTVRQYGRNSEQAGTTSFLYPAKRDENLRGLYLMGFGAIDIIGGWSSAGIIPSIQMAIDDINRRPDILPGYQLIVDMRDSKCDAGVAVRSLYEHLISPPVKVMILGGGCSVATVPVARTAPLYGLNQMAYSAASPELSRRDLYPTFFRTAMSDFAMNPPIIALCLEYNWRHVATIHESDPLFSTTINQIHRYFIQANITLVTAESFAQDPAEPLKNIKRKKGRVIFLDTYEPAGARAFCEIYKLGMFGARYQWIIPGWWNERWWELNIDQLDCTIDQLLTAINYSITVTDLKGDLSGERTVSGQTYAEYVTRYLSWPTLPIYGENAYHSFGYDSVWAASLALNKTMVALAKKSVSEILLNGTEIWRPKRLDDFQYNTEPEMSQQIWKDLNEVSFHGVSGPVSFELGERSGLSDVRQMRGTDHVRFAVFAADKKKLSWLGDILWHSGRPPIAWPETVFVINYKNYVLAFSACAISLLGILLALGFLLFNIKNSGHLHIKMSSSKLNNVIVVGSVMAYISIVLVGLDTNFVNHDTMLTICSARVWILSTSFTLAFGAMFAKIWRVHRIFTKLVHENQAVHDHHLLGFVGILVIMDLAILTPWMIIDPLQLEYVNFLTIESEKCTCQYVWYWMGAVYLVKGLLLVFGGFLAYETRKVSIPGLNDSKYVGVCVYNVVVMCLVGVTVSLVLTDQETIVFSFQATCILFCTTMTLCVLFIPKVSFVRKHPEQAFGARKVTGKKAGGESNSGSSTFQYSMKSTMKSTGSLNTLSGMSMDGVTVGVDLNEIIAENEKDMARMRGELRAQQMEARALVRKLEDLEGERSEIGLKLEKALRDCAWQEALDIIADLDTENGFIKHVCELYAPTRDSPEVPVKTESDLIPGNEGKAFRNGMPDEEMQTL